MRFNIVMLLSIALINYKGNANKKSYIVETMDKPMGYRHSENSENNYRKQLCEDIPCPPGCMEVPTKDGMEKTCSCPDARCPTCCHYGCKDGKWFCIKNGHCQHGHCRLECSQQSCKGDIPFARTGCIESPTNDGAEKSCSCPGKFCPGCCGWDCTNGGWTCNTGCGFELKKCPGDNSNDCIGLCDIRYPSNWTGPKEIPTIEECPARCSFCSSGGVRPRPNTVVKSSCFELPPP